MLNDKFPLHEEEWIEKLAIKIFSDIEALSKDKIGVSRESYGKGEALGINYLIDLAEEFGFVGVLLLVMIYAFVLLRCFYLAVNARDRFCRLVIGGFIFTFCFNVFVNLAMVVGLIPVVGMPLPFFSRGGTSLLSLFIMFGIITSMASHKKFMQR